ncbi:MAG: hypothetical protein KJ559_02290 [Nanoarchaeota archaeon]|nr:hypothetical protein [Nanoarchaeota archaeon]
MMPIEEPHNMEDRGENLPPEYGEDEKDKYEYLRPNKYFKFYIFVEQSSKLICWLPEGFIA